MLILYLNIENLIFWFKVGCEKLRIVKCQKREGTQNDYWVIVTHSLQFLKGI